MDINKLEKIVPIAIGGAILAGAILPKKSFDRLLLLGGIGVGGYFLLQRIPKAEDITNNIMALLRGE